MFRRPLDGLWVISGIVWGIGGVVRLGDDCVSLVAINESGGAVSRCQLDSRLRRTFAADR